MLKSRRLFIFCECFLLTDAQTRYFCKCKTSFDGKYDKDKTNETADQSRDCSDEYLMGT